jgi:integrase
MTEPAALRKGKGVREIWRKLARKLDIAPWTTHQLRHTCATELLEAGVPELVIAEHLGHHGLGSLHIYGQVRERQRQQAVDVMGELIRPGSVDRLPKFRPGPRR